MAGNLMPIAHRRNAAVIAQTQQAQQARANARNRLPDLATYLTIPNPNANQQRDAVRLLVQAQQESISGVIGG